MTLRGVNTIGSHLITSHLTGAIRDDARTRQEFLRLTRRA
jgi:GTP cyclohydrolase I